MEWVRDFNFPDGSTYEGEWVNGFMNGEGTFTWIDGNKKQEFGLMESYKNNVKTKLFR